MFNFSIVFQHYFLCLSFILTVYNNVFDLMARIFFIPYVRRPACCDAVHESKHVFRYFACEIMAAFPA